MQYPLDGEILLQNFLLQNVAAKLVERGREIGAHLHWHSFVHCS
jgi:hypothetical protein